MNRKTARVFQGWLSLSTVERDEVEREMESYKRKSSSDQYQIRENVTKVASGPVSEACPCCGRG